MIKKVISEKIKSNRDGLCAQTDKLYLRKEILKILNLNDVFGAGHKNARIEKREIRNNDTS